MEIKQIVSVFLLTLSLVDGNADTNQKIKGNCNTEVNANGKVTVNINCADSKNSTNKFVEEWTFVDRYLVKGGLVKDPIVGLIWMRCSIGQNWNGSTCTGKATKLTWEQAMNIPKHFDYARFSDWRVPTREELKALVYCSNDSQEYYVISFFVISSACTGSYIRPTITQSAFPNTPTIEFWSSSYYSTFSFLNTKYSDSSWNVNFKNGSEVKGWHFFLRSDIAAIRLVRRGQ